MRVKSLLRYPVKSMLGESAVSMSVDKRGAEGDRRLALVDAETRHVTSAKGARLWRGRARDGRHGRRGSRRADLGDCEQADSRLTNIAAELRELASFRDAGIIQEEEFNEHKQCLLPH